MHGSEVIHDSLKSGSIMAGEINLKCECTLFVLVLLLQLLIKPLASSNSCPSFLFSIDWVQLPRWVFKVTDL